MIRFSGFYNQLHPAQLRCGDALAQPNWEYIRALRIQLRRHQFHASIDDNFIDRSAMVAEDILGHAYRHLKGEPEVCSLTYELHTQRYRKEVEIGSSTTVRDPSRVVIGFSSGFNDDNGRHILGRTTFYHYLREDPSAKGLSELIGPASSLVSTRPGHEICYENFADVPEDIAYAPPRRMIVQAVARLGL